MFDKKTNDPKKRTVTCEIFFKQTHTTGGFFFEGVSKDVKLKTLQVVKRRPSNGVGWQLLVPSRKRSCEAAVWWGFGFFMLNLVLAARNAEIWGRS